MLPIKHQLKLSESPMTYPIGQVQTSREGPLKLQVWCFNLGQTSWKIFRHERGYGWRQVEYHALLPCHWSVKHTGQDIMRKTKQCPVTTEENCWTLRVKIQDVCQIYCKAHKSSFQGLTAGWWMKDEVRMRCRWNRGEKRLTVIP